MSPSSTYWAALPREELGQVLAKKVEDWRRFCGNSPIIKRQVKSFLAKYGFADRQGASAHEVTRGGKQGEIARLKVNHYGPLLRLRKTLAIQSKPAWSPVPTNSDHDSTADAAAATTLLDYYYRQQRIDRAMAQATDDCEWAGEGFVVGQWNVQLGEDVAVDDETGETLKTGDLEFWTPTPLEMIRDTTARGYKALRWKMPVRFENKWEMASQFPEHAEAILSADGKKWDVARLDRLTNEMEPDEIPVFHFFHEKTPAKPDGRYVVMVGEGTVLLDVPLPYRAVPVFRMAEEDLKGTPFGHSPMLDCLGPQEVLDALTSAIVSQQTAHAIRKLVAVKNSGLNYRQLADAMAVLEVNDMSQKPTTLDFSEVSPQVFAFRERLISEMQMLANVNDVVRGVINPNVKSGAHAALYDATAIRASNDLQEAYHQLAEDLGTFVVHTLADYAGDSERTYRIVGEANKGLVQTFSSSKLAGIERVQVEVTNHVGKTATGKQAIAELLLQSGALGQDPGAVQKFIQLIRYGQLDEMLEGPTHNLMRIKRQKESLSRGERNSLLISDTHWLDIPEKLAVLAQPETRANEAVVAAVLEEVAEHLALWSQMPPDMLAAMGGPPPPSMTPMPMPGAPSGTPAPAPGGPQSATDMPGAGADMPEAPNMPINPATGAPHSATGAA